MKFSYTPFIILLVLSALSLAVWQCNTQGQTISYNQHIRPIFNQKCLACHGGVKAKGGFSLLFEEEAFATTDSGEPAIVPGNHHKSELYRRLIHEDPEQRMPLDHEPLTEEEIDLIARWIDQGAEWEEHWAYIPPRTVDVPAVRSDWVKNDIDPFILRKLEENGLTPEAEADRNILIRRLSLDLTGLPPTPEEVDAFVNDTSPDAYEQLVDRLLASPHFGERWAAMWLDLARYADSKGYEKDPYRNIWRYRDWVIEAFNRDLSFDQFTIEQLAGDMLPNPTRDQLIATAFHRNTMTNTEGGTDDEEFRVAAVIDRLNTTYEVWQATTMSCIQCHSHPYDPFRHEEFYQSYDFFNQTQDGDLDTDVPRLASFPEMEEQQLREIIGFVSELESERNIDTSALWSTQVRQAIFPVLLPIHCDDFENVSFGGNGSVSNWIYNLKSMEGKHFRFQFENVDLTGLESVVYHYKTAGNDAKIELRIDDPEGPLVHEHAFSATSGNNARWSNDGFEPVELPVESLSGHHDLYFEIINTTNKAPEGMVVIRDIELNYEGADTPAPQLAEHREKLRTILAGKADYTPIMKPKTPEMTRQTKIFERGNWLVQERPVEAKAPEVLLRGRETPTDRLEFARWLVSSDNPMTARVIVNRFWEQLFGRGIVETLEDFGTQSDPPSHPELLDFLALRFMNEHGWSVKSLLKEIAMSAAYRQSSKTTPEKLEIDPYNRLLSRGARFRLSAEQIRDQALAVSGLLYDTIGGRSVMPPQPEGVWQIIYSGEQWKTPDNEMRYRRGIYTYWKRTTPYPSMVAFDSPSREFCVSRRIRTNTPLQALVTLNDPVYLEAARALAQRMRTAGGDDLDACFQYGYKRALAKEADAETVTVLQELYDQAWEELKHAPAKARTIAHRDETDEMEVNDPMTVVANAIMNLDGFLVKE